MSLRTHLRLELLVLAAVACGGSSALSPVDLSHPQGDLASGNDVDLAGPASGDMPAGAKCTTYTPTTIAAMRAAGTAGCVEVGMSAGVVTLASVASSKTATFAVQDASGGDNSAVIAKCSTSTGTMYPCAVFASASAIAAGRSVLLDGFYAKTATGIETLHIIDTATDKGVGTPPAPATVTLAQVAHASSLSDRKLYYQKVTTTLPGGTMLKAYEFAPAAFKSTATCPSTYGFGLIPSTSAATAGPACTGTNPAMPVTGTPDAAEILIDTTFYKSFSYSSDCPCNKPPGVLLTSSDTFTKLGGILGYDGAVTTVSPTLNADVGK